MRNSRKIIIRLLGIHRHGIQNTAVVIPHCIVYRIYHYAAIKIDRQRFILFLVAPAPFYIKISLDAGLQIYVANERT